MRLLLVSDTVFDENGVSRFIQDMAHESNKHNKEFSVLTSSPILREDVPQNIVNLKPFISFGIPFYSGLFFAIAPYLRFMRTIKEYKPDIMHISTPGPVGLMALYAAWRYSIPFMSTYHTDFPSYIYKVTNNRLLKRVMTSYMRFFYKKAKYVLTRSDAYDEILQTNIFIAKEDIIALHAGTDTNKFHPKYKKQNLWSAYGVQEESIKLLYVGRLSLEKNFDWLIEFFLKNKHNMRQNNIELICVGHGNFLENADKYKEDGIHLLGIKRGEELSRIYASSDLFITPSVTETLGQVVLEAMASRLACIVTNQGGPSLFVTQECGFALEFGDEKLWLDTINKLSKSKELREGMGEASFQRIKKFSIGATFEEFWKIHNSFESKKSDR